MFKDLLKDRKTATELEVAVDEAEAAEKKHAARVAELEQERPRLLLDGSDAEVRALEQDLADAKLAQDRAKVAGEELQKRHAEALEAEDRARKEAIVKQAEDAAKRGLKIIKRYEQEIAPGLAKDMAELEEINRQVYDAKRDAPELARMLGTPQQLYAAEIGTVHSRNITGAVELPVAGGMHYHWSARHNAT